MSRELETTALKTEPAPKRETTTFVSDPLWYKDAIIYEVHVRSFYDSVDDGMGDFPGLTKKLDYIQELGVTAIWVLPFCPSPWKDDGYDISDYTDVHPAYGTLRDFEVFLREAHRRGLRVITELVLNHTSDQHQWFQRSRRAKPGSHWRNFYVWSDTPEKYKEARIIFKDFEPSNWTYDPIAKAYYWHRFFAHQPDLNYDYPPVRKAMLQAMDFWLDMGVDGLRLDAVPYLYEREGTNCENLPETHEYLKELRRHIDAKYQDRMILAEANQWPEDAIAYFGNGDECQMAFHFPLMPRLFMALRMEDRYPVTDILQLTPAIPENCQWALFLRNHDELTLEMVTDEERDYMYRMYAEDRPMRINLGIRRRLAPLLGNDRRKIELMNALLLSLPGTPVIYYGDEIGMGDNFYLGDRNGVRTPMQWSADRNAGFSRANPQKLYLPVIIDPEYQYEALNVEAQQNSANSLLWWMRRILAQRKRSKAFGRGTLEFLTPENRRVLAFIRQFENERILVVANLSRFVQAVELDLRNFAGFKLIEMFGGTEFPAVTERPYLLTLGPHAFYWLTLEQQEAAVEATGSRSGEQRERPIQVISWEEPFSETVQLALARVLPSFLRARPWFLSRNRRVRTTELADVIPIPETSCYVLLVRVEFDEGEPEIYQLSLSVAHGPEIEQIERNLPDFILAHLQSPDGTKGLLYSAFRDRKFPDALLGLTSRRRRVRTLRGELIGSHTRSLRRILGSERPNLEASVPRPSPQNNTSIFFGDRFMMKIYRRLEAGPNPEQEILQWLTAEGFANAPHLAGHIEYRNSVGETVTTAILESYIPHQANGWNYTLDNQGLFLERAMAAQNDVRLQQVKTGNPLELEPVEAPQVVCDLVGSFQEMARLLGQRTGELHMALSRNQDDPAFVPESFTDFYRQGLYHGMLGHATRCFTRLRSSLRQMNDDTRAEAERLLASEQELRARLKPLRDHRVPTVRTRIHGDFHLGQVLFTGKDFVFIDFEGDPRRAIGERRIKYSPLRDVAGVLRSFHYGAHAALYGQVPGIVPQKESSAQLHRWAGFWYRWVGAAFLHGYLTSPGVAKLLNISGEQLRIVLDAYLIERGMIEILSDLQNRPEWARIPIVGMLEILGPEP
ncbi:MAG TPA: maltose alpha-D-glucosyltransferase [Terriglobales bacterium]|nr:maltose alpha-D-glucosyltransferase [Terriglobales bacterium]